MSGSMEGAKLGQMKDAMRAVLSELNVNASGPDVFNIVTFSDTVSVWSSEPVLATTEALLRANTAVGSIAAGGGTNIDAAIEEGLRQLSKLPGPESLAKFIVFLTDGQATVGVRHRDAILANVAQRNSDSKHSIHCIAFGDDADYDLLKRLSLRNAGIARKIYADSDAAIQLEGFYAEITSPLLSKVRIAYLNESILPASLVQDDDDVSDIYYDGGEIMIAGVLTDTTAASVSLSVEVSAMSSEGPVRLAQTFRTLPEVSRGTQSPSDPATIGGFVERTWAYLTIKKLLSQAKYNTSSDGAKLKDQALALSLKYNFVTEVSSLLVTLDDKPLSLDGKEPSRSVDDSDNSAFQPRFMAGYVQPCIPVPDSGAAADVSSQLIAEMDRFPTTSDIQALGIGGTCPDVLLADEKNLRVSRQVHKFFIAINRYADWFINFSSAKDGSETIREYDENNVAVSASIAGVQAKLRVYRVAVCEGIPDRCSEKRLSKSGNQWLKHGTAFLDHVLDFVSDYSNDKAYRLLNETRTVLVAMCETTDFASFVIGDTVTCDLMGKDCSDGHRFHCYALAVAIRALAGRVCAALRSSPNSQCHDDQLTNIGCHCDACAGSLEILQGCPRTCGIC